MASATTLAPPVAFLVASTMVCLAGTSVAACEPGDADPSGASGSVVVAVATNGAQAIRALARDFERRSGCGVTLVVGSTGKLYAQIVNGAPFDLFLAADRERPRLLVERGLAVDGSRRTWALGRLALWSLVPALEPSAAALRAGRFRRLAIANPDLAPYGAAARDTLVQLGLWETLKPRIVVGENVGQSFAMAASGAAELGFVALASAHSWQGGAEARHWEVPEHLHEPIRQDVVLLRRSEENREARAFHAFLATPEALRTLRSFGFRTPPE